MPRNSLLFGLMQRMGLVEKVGSGILRMKKLMREVRLKPPRFETDENWFTVSLRRPSIRIDSFPPSSEKSSEKVTGGERAKKVLWR